MSGLGVFQSVTVTAEVDTTIWDELTDIGKDKLNDQLKRLRINEAGTTLALKGPLSDITNAAEIIKRAHRKYNKSLSEIEERRQESGALKSTQNDVAGDSDEGELNEMRDEFGTATLQNEGARFDRDKDSRDTLALHLTEEGGSMRNSESSLADKVARDKKHASLTDPITNKPSGGHHLASLQHSDHTKSKSRSRKLKTDDVKKPSTTALDLSSQTPDATTGIFTVDLFLGLWMKARYWHKMTDEIRRYTGKLAFQVRGDKLDFVVTWEMSHLEDTRRTMIRNSLESFIGTAERRHISGRKLPSPITKIHKSSITSESTFIVSDDKGDEYIVGEDKKEVDDIYRLILRDSANAKTTGAWEKSDTFTHGHIGTTKTDATRLKSDDEDYDNVPSDESKMSRDTGAIPKSSTPRRPDDSVIEQLFIDHDVWMYMENIRVAELTGISSRCDVKVTQNEAVVQVDLKGSKERVLEAKQDIFDLSQEVGDEIRTEDIDISRCELSPEDQTRLLLSIKTKFQDFVFDMQGTFCHVIGPKHRLHEVKDIMNTIFRRRKRDRRLVKSETRKSSPGGDKGSHSGSRSSSPPRHVTTTTSTATRHTSSYTTDASNAVVDGMSFRYKFQSKEYQIHIITGDITRCHTRAIVNAADENLLNAGGVSKAIATAGGREFRKACRDLITRDGSLQVAEPKVTNIVSSLPANFVVHVVGPKWDSYEPIKCVKVLRKAFHGCMKEANKKKVSSIAIPAVSSGTFGVPANDVVEQFYKAVVEFCEGRPSHLKDIVFIDMRNDVISLAQYKFSSVANSKSPLTFTSNDCGRFLPTKIPTAGILNTYSRSPSRSSRTAATVTTTTHHSPAVSSLSYWSTSSSSYSPSAYTSSSISSTIPVIRSTWGPSSHGAYAPTHVSTLVSPSDPLHPSSGFTGQYDTLTGSFTVDLTTRPGAAHPLYTTSMSTTPSHTVVTYTSSVTSPPAVLSRYTHQETFADDAPKEEEKDICCICMCQPDKPETLRCKHVFCKECIDEWFKTKPTCPSCGKVYGEMKGNQPDGTMTDNWHRDNLPGYERDSYGTLVISYQFSGGIQGPNHPNPGRRYHGTSRTGYLPDNTEGREVLRLLRRAFDAKLVFTIGRSTTTGAEDQITWNDIHHKTNTHGGPDRYGYPDPTYLVRVRAELADKGIK